MVAVQHHIGAERIREYDDERDAELGERSQLLRLLTHLADCSGLSPPDEKIRLCTGVLGKPERLLIVGLESPAVSVSIKVSGKARLG